MGVVDETDFIYQSGKVNPARELYREMQDMRVQYVKLAERFKHHDKEKKTIETDWNDYLKYCDTWQFYFPKLHAAEIQQQYDLWFLLWDDINESKIKMTEITKRFDELDIS